MNYFFIFCFSCISIAAFSQTIERQLIGSTGFSVQLSTAGVDCTVGEPLIAFSTSADNILSQGFLQPDMDGIISVEQFESAIISLYPNPTRSQFFIETNEVITQLEMFDASGRLVFSIGLNAPSGAINPGDLGQGVYHVRITTADKIYSRKIQIL